MPSPHPVHVRSRHAVPSRSWRALLVAFVRDERGQDLIEYGLLSLFIGIVTLAVWASIQDNLRAAYLDYDGGTQNIWQSPDPGGA